MILVIGALLYISVLSFLYGSAATILLGRFLPSSNQPRMSLSVVMIIGLVVLALIAGYLSIFTRIALVANLAVAVTALGFYLMRRREINHLARGHISALRTQRPLILLMFTLVVVFVLIEVVEVPKVGDSGLYHVQTSKWIEKYGVVPGLGNLHGMYAWNAMWYPLSAQFGLSFLGTQPLHVVNGLLFIVAVGFFFGGVSDVMNRSTALTSIMKVAALPFSLFAYKAQIGSPSTDLPAALLVWVAFILCLENSGPSGTFRSRTTNVLVVLLSVYVVTVKLTVLPILLLCLYLFYLEWKRRDRTDVWLQIGVVLIVLIPWAARNVIVSGYLVYPFPYLDVFHVDWKLPYDYVISEIRATRGWSRLPGPHSLESLDMPPWEWIPKWLGWVYYRYLIVIVAAFVAMLVYIPIIVLRARTRRLRTGARDVLTRDVLYLVACIGVVYWFATAPDPRFGWGFIFVALVIPLVPIAQWLFTRFESASRLGVLALVMFYIVSNAYLSVRSVPSTFDIVLSPVSYPREKLSSKRIGKIVIFSPSGTDHCWDAPLPCTPILNDHLRARGDDLESGFRIAHVTKVGG